MNGIMTTNDLLGEGKAASLQSTSHDHLTSNCSKQTILLQSINLVIGNCILSRSVAGQADINILWKNKR